MPRLFLALLAILAMSASPVAAVRLAGDAELLRVTSLAATPDGGWILAGFVRDTTWPGDGLVLRADAADQATWAVWTRGIVVNAVAALPDGGALVGGGSGLLARLDASGATAWAASVGGADVRALSCTGWDCVAAGDAAGRGFLLRLDASTGGASLEIEAAVGAAAVIPTAVLLLPSGDTLVGCIIEAESLASAALGRIDPGGSTLWAREISGPHWMDSPDVFTDNAIRALAAWPDGRLLAIGENPYTEPIAVTLASDGTPLAGLDYSSAPFTRPRSAAILPSGDLLVGGYPSRAALFDSSLATLDVVGLGDAGERQETRLALALAGDAVVASGGVISRIAVDLSAADACSTVAPAAFARRHVAAIANTPVATLEFPDRDALGLTPRADPFSVACVSGACLIACERDCGNALDDDGDAVVDCDDGDCAGEPACGAADPDGDGVPNSADCRPRDAGVSSVPSGLATLMVASWGSAPRIPILRWRDATPPIDHFAAAADIARGSLAELHAQRDTSRGSCVARRQGGVGYWDAGGAAIPGSLWYLVRPWNACGPGPWESAALDAGMGGCP